MKMSVLSSLPALIHVTTSWEAFPVPVPLASLSPQRATHAKVRQETTRLWEFFRLITRYTIMFLSQIICLSSYLPQTYTLVSLNTMQILMSVPRTRTCATTTSSVSTQWEPIAARPSVDQDLSPASQEPAVKASH